MINVSLTDKKFWENEVEGYIFLLKEDLQSIGNNDELKKIEKDFYPNLRNILKKHKFTGKFGQSFVLTATRDNSLIQFVFIGMGKLQDKWNIELENLRRAIGSAVNILKKLDIKNAVINIPDEKIFGLVKPRLVRQIVLISYIADYEFEKYKSDKTLSQWKGELILCVKKEDEQVYAQSLKEGKIIGQSTNLARDFSDLPANYLTPASLAEQAKKIAVQYGLQYKVFGREKAAEYGMGGFLAVDSGSDEEGKFVVLEYSCEKKDAPTIALVGKGVTFDSGGISLKPSAYMEGMKFDMSGAATVIATMNAIAQLQPKINVVGITPLVENMPSGKACKQDDIITFMNGKTAEIKNTDAEGRLILADALCYAEKFYKPEVILDIATLTGACLFALGHFFTGLMTRDEIVGTKLQAISLVSGDRVWPLPMDNDFKDAIKSDVADIANCGAPNYKAGTITAAWFLSNFVQNAKWAHLDIAGTADSVPGISYFGKGSTGAGVRLFVDFIMNYTK
ncbi:leucyl aminopeptidase [Candidatus Dependentiae bacterium]|nr:leucyl aminopeptidase [Candidatus Dependentiae bacterium]